MEGYTIMRGLPVDFSADEKTRSIDDQFMFGPSIMVCPVTEYMYHRPPESTVLMDRNILDARRKPGLLAKYYKDPRRTSLRAKEQIDPDIDLVPGTPPAARSYLT